MKSLRLLIIEDEEDHALLMVRELRKGGFDPAFERVETPQELSAALDAGLWDAVISDFNLPGFNGLDALRIVQAKGLDLPFILVSGVIGEEMAVESMKAGAHDFILKANLARLVPSLERELRDAEMRRERSEAVEALRRAHAELEQRVAERTAELQAANTKLLDSRRAALNMMEDAIAARRQADEASAELEREATDRMQAEEALRESELFYRQMLESIPGMVFTTRPDGYCDYQSQQWVDFTGVPMIEHLGDGWNKLLHPDDRPRAFAAWHAAVEERAPYDLEYRVRRHDGAYEWFKVRGRPIRNVAGEIVRWFGIALNIDHLIKAEEELRQAKDEWELTFNSVPDLIAIMDDRHRMVRVNKAMAERLGREPAECMGIPCYEAIHGSNLPPEFCPHSRTMDDGREHTVELHAERLEADFLVSTTPLLNSQGLMTGTVHVARDITERKRFEEELLRAKEAAEAATRAKSQFLANMSHELRTPMTGVLGMLELVLADDLEAEQKEFIEIAQNSASSLIRILNDILDLTKIEAGKFAIDEKPFSLRKCVEDTVSLLLPSALSKGLDLSFKVADNVPEILVADHLRLNQVLTNLAGNAVKFTEKGQVEIRVSAGSSTPDGKREINFTVTDTGIGIPADKKHLLFQVFSQVDDSHTRIHGGTGLGLVICKELVERMGGTITFTSEEGKGSIFAFTIPLAEAEAERVDISPKMATEKDTPRAAETTKPRLLLAEDDPTIRQFLGVMLQRSNFELETAEDGEKVVEMWENGSYDLILMDVQMPRMNGFEAAAAIRAKEVICGEHIPIVAITGHAFREDEEKCLAAGMDSYIAKPIDYKKSVQIINDLIKNRKESAS